VDHIARIALLACLTVVVACAAAAGPAAANTGGVQALELPFLGPVRPASNGGAAPTGTNSGGAAVGERPATRRGRSVRPRRHTRRGRVLHRRGKRRHVRHPHGSGGASPTAPTPKPAPTPVPVPAPDERGHRFPVGGSFSFGGSGSRFGAPREGHTHQGQDIAAAEGTPVLAPWAGRVEFVRYQAAGAGWYIVLNGDGEGRAYVFMHLRTGTIRVTPGQHVSAGTQLAEVGTTGASTGPHLHFEVWVGGWYVPGGHPVDPLPLLKAWLAD